SPALEPYSGTWLSLGARAPVKPAGPAGGKFVKFVSGLSGALARLVPDRDHYLEENAGAGGLGRGAFLVRIELRATRERGGGQARGGRVDVECPELGAHGTSDGGRVTRHGRTSSAGGRQLRG